MHAKLACVGNQKLKKTKVLGADAASDLVSNCPMCGKKVVIYSLW